MEIGTLAEWVAVSVSIVSALGASGLLVRSRNSKKNESTPLQASQQGNLQTMDRSQQATAQSGGFKTVKTNSTQPSIPGLEIKWQTGKDSHGKDVWGVRVHNSRGKLENFKFTGRDKRTLKHFSGFKELSEGDRFFKSRGEKFEYVRKDEFTYGDKLSDLNKTAAYTIESVSFTDEAGKSFEWKAQG